MELNWWYNSEQPDWVWLSREQGLGSGPNARFWCTPTPGWPTHALPSPCHSFSHPVHPPYTLPKVFCQPSKAGLAFYQLGLGVGGLRPAHLHALAFLFQCQHKCILHKGRILLSYTEKWYYSSKKQKHKVHLFIHQEYKTREWIAPLDTRVDHEVMLTILYIPWPNILIWSISSSAFNQTEASKVAINKNWAIYYNKMIITNNEHEKQASATKGQTGDPALWHNYSTGEL